MIYSLMFRPKQKRYPADIPTGSEMLWTRKCVSLLPHVCGIYPDVSCVCPSRDRLLLWVSSRSNVFSHILADVEDATTADSFISRVSNFWPRWSWPLLSLMCNLPHRTRESNASLHHERHCWHHLHLRESKRRLIPSGRPDGRSRERASSSLAHMLCHIKLCNS